MSGSDWRKYVKIVGIASASFFVLFIIYITAFYSGNVLGYYEREADSSSSQYGRDTERHIDDCFKLPARPAISQCITKAVTSSHENQRAEYDLNAQREMSQWAWWAMIIGILQFFATIITLGFIKLTLDATLKAVEETSGATDAMEKANGIAQKANERERRPWLKVGYIALDDMMSIAPKVTIDIVNTGRSTAVMISSHVEVCICDRLPMTRPYQGKKGNSPFRKIKNIKAGTSASATKPIEAFVQTMPAIKKGVLKLYIMGWVQYKDCGIPRRTMFCRLYDPKTRKLIPTNDPDYEVQH